MACDEYDLKLSPNDAVWLWI